LADGDVQHRSGLDVLTMLEGPRASSLGELLRLPQRLSLDSFRGGNLCRMQIGVPVSRLGGVVLRAARSTQHTVMHGADGRAAFKAEHFVSGSLIPPRRSHAWLQIYHTSDKRRDEMGHMMRQGGRAHHTCPAREHGRGRLCCCPVLSSSQQPAARSPQPAARSPQPAARVWRCQPASQ
jgi:hypothetical protein